MAIVANVVSQQSMQFDVPGIAPAGASRVFVTTGIAQFFLSAASQTNAPVSQTQGIKLLVDPVIAPGQFRKATAVVGLGNITRQDSNLAGPVNTCTWRIEDIAASLDDESGKVELRFEATVTSAGPSSETTLQSVTFQVTTIATL